jgi:hypothetical protein
VCINVNGVSQAQIRVTETTFRDSGRLAPDDGGRLKLRIWTREGGQRKAIREGRHRVRSGRRSVGGLSSC